MWGVSECVWEKQKKNINLILYVQRVMDYLYYNYNN